AAPCGGDSIGLACGHLRGKSPGNAWQSSVKKGAPHRSPGGSAPHSISYPLAAKMAEGSVLAHLGKALAAVDRTVLARLERHLAGLAAAGADSVVHLALGAVGALHGGAAVLAAFGFVLKAALGVELLLAGSPDELFAAVLAY